MYVIYQNKTWELVTPIRASLFQLAKENNPDLKVTIQRNDGTEIKVVLISELESYSVERNRHYFSKGL